MQSLSGPIPGQSLTTEPKGFPWERPPEISDPEAALQMHLTKMSDPKRLRIALDLLELDGLDIKTVVQGRLRGAVAQGMHSIDVALIIAPVIHEFIKQAAAAAGIEADDGFEDKVAEENYRKARVVGLTSKEFEELGGRSPKTVAKESMEIPETPKEKTTPRKGFMAREDI